MAIVHFNFPEGVPHVPESKESQNSMLGLILGHDLEILLPGNHIVTPEKWLNDHRIHDHEVTVFDNGNGLYRALPVLGLPETSQDNPDTAGTQRPIDALNPLCPIAEVAENPNSNSEIRILAILAYMPIFASRF